jgi:hypothetical protein
MKDTEVINLTVMEEVKVDVDEIRIQIIEKLEKMKFKEVEDDGDIIVGRRKSKGESKISFTIKVEVDLEEYEDGDVD